MNLKCRVTSVHVCPPHVRRCTPYAFQRNILRLQSTAASDGLPKCTLPQFIQTRWTRSMSRPGSGMQPRCSSNSSHSSATSRNSYAWRKRIQQAKRILLFAGPALSIPLADPAMQLMDSVVIGQCAGTSQLAALGPNLVVINAFTYSLTSLCVACMSAMATALQSGEDRLAGDALSVSLILAAVAGTIFLLALQAHGPRLIALTGCMPDLIAPAWDYMRVRAWSMPPILYTLVGMSGMLAQQDPWTPAALVALHVSTKLAGNLLFVTWLGMGLAGAAWASVASQWITAVAVSIAVCLKPARPHLKIPGQRELAAIASTCGPATILYVAKTAAYLLIQATATSLSTLALAAHQPVWSVWGLGSFCQTPMEQAALAFLPSAKTAEDVRETVTVLLGLALCIGVVTASVTAGLPAFLPMLFTPDRRLWPLMRTVAPQAMISLLACSLEVAAAGVLTARKQFTFLVGAMVLTLGLVAAYCTAVRTYNWGLTGVWWGLVLFFGLRGAQSLGRILVVIYMRRPHPSVAQV